MSGKKKDIYRHAKTLKLYLLGTLPQEANGGCTPAKWGANQKKEDRGSKKQGRQNRTAKGVPG